MSEYPSHLMVFKKWHIGSITITRVQEMDRLTLPPEWLLKTNADRVLMHPWLQGDFASPDGQIYANIQAFVIEAEGKRIMVDPCIGNHKQREGSLFNMLDNPFLERLTAAGFPPESIDIVLCTHLHVDHCGWNTQLVGGEWVPTFPNAEYLFSQTEYDFAKSDIMADQEATFRDSVTPVVDAGLAKVVSFDHHIVDGVSLEPSPGHTQGHCCILISSDGEEAVITGDMIHHPIQVCEPDVCSNFCWNDEQAIATRKALLERYSGTSKILLGTHFPEPTGVYVLPHGQVWQVRGA